MHFNSILKDITKILDEIKITVKMSISMKTEY